jgi:hypothetical protein
MPSYLNTSELLVLSSKPFLHALDLLKKSLDLSLNLKLHVAQILSLLNKSKIIKKACFA